ncbi:MAG: outer membrane protein assembly factor BamB [Lysobacterales bacterium CG02_land_8_20_14_3_00_62_12]|nr:MAG: outer membrane protein assembly factor BamB [Xanthomonadales bacterium CG02_land_8_20_14_3_00_62_12]
MRNLGWILLVLALLPGCKLFKGKDKEIIDPPAVLAKFTPTATIKKLWSTSTGDGVARTGAKPRPAYADGRIYVTDADAGLRAYGADNGRKLWNYSSKQPLVSGVSVAGDLLVVGSIEGNVIALSAQTGAERWHAQISSEILVAPVIDAAVVVARSNDGRITGLDATDGKILWKFDRGAPLISLRGNSQPIALAGTIYAAYDNARVVALRASDGVLLWEQTISRAEGRTELERMNDVDGEIQIVDDVIYAVSYRGQVVALTIDNGRILWSRDMSSYVGLAFSGKVVFGADEHSNVWALDYRSGSSLWKSEGLSNRWLTSPVTMGELLVVGDFKGYLHWLKSDDGSFAAREKVAKKGIRSTPLVVGNRVYVATVDGHLAAFEVAGG